MSICLSKGGRREDGNCVNNGKGRTEPDFRRILGPLSLLDCEDFDDEDREEDASNLRERLLPSSRRDGRKKGSHQICDKRINEWKRKEPEFDLFVTQLLTGIIVCSSHV